MSDIQARIRNLERKLGGGMTPEQKRAMSVEFLEVAIESTDCALMHPASAEQVDIRQTAILWYDEKRSSCAGAGLAPPKYVLRDGSVVSPEQLAALGESALEPNNPQFSPENPQSAAPGGVNSGTPDER